MKIYTIGGYNEVGKNMTVVELKDDAFAFDAGIYLPAVVDLQEKYQVISPKMLKNSGALPNDSILEKKGIKHKIRAFLIGHAHLDHVGAVPYITNKYKAEVIGTPFTMQVLKSLLEDKIHLKNRMKTLQPNSSYFIQGRNNKYKVDFINITHSTLQTSLIALHTKEGIVLYANDFKLDNHPVFGKKPNYDKIKQLAKQGVKVLIIDSLYSGSERKTPSEKIARALVEEALLTVDHQKRGVIVTTFSSHIARLKSIVDFGKQLNRQIVFMGRSLNKYVTAAKAIKMCPFAKDIRIFSYKKQRDSMFKKINKNRKDYLVVCTGHQGEQGAVLDRLSRDDLPFSFAPQDSVIFSSKVIPTPINISNRNQMEKRLKKKNVRIFDHVHVSGHAGKEDLRDFINLVGPEHIIPAHGSLEQLTPMAELAREIGYNFRTCHIMQDSQILKI